MISSQAAQISLKHDEFNVAVAKKSYQSSEFDCLPTVFLRGGGVARSLRAENKSSRVITQEYCITRNVFINVSEMF